MSHDEKVGIPRLATGVSGLDAITREVEAASPAFVVVDSFRTLVRKAGATPTAEVELQAFVQRLAPHLTSWQATTFLLGEYGEGEIHNNPVFTVADGLYWLSQAVERNAIVRKLQVVKLRGQASVPGLHTFRITAAGLRQGEPGIVAVFEERPAEYAARATSFGLDLDTPVQAEQLQILYLRSLDLSVDETLQELLDAVTKVGAKRLVIDSLAGFELALAPSFRQSLYRMIGALTGRGVTIVSTVEVAESFTDLPLSSYAISFLTDDIIRLRYIELAGQLRKVLMVVKMRGGAHSQEICEYTITAAGLALGEGLAAYRGLVTGTPERTRPAKAEGPTPRRRDTPHA